MQSTESAEHNSQAAWFTPDEAIGHTALTGSSLANYHPLLDQRLCRYVLAAQRRAGKA